MELKVANTNRFHCIRYCYWTEIVESDSTNATCRSGAQLRFVLVRITVVHFDVSSTFRVTADVGSFNCRRMSQYYVSGLYLAHNVMRKTFSHPT